MIARRTDAKGWRPWWLLAAGILMAVLAEGRLPGAETNHWAFQPIAEVSPPSPRGAELAGGANAIDRFIRAKLDEQGIRPAPPADCRTFIRRVTFDLTGLPPTVEEVAAFESECAAESRAGGENEKAGKRENGTVSSSRFPVFPSSVPLAPRACARLVDRLLASPRYGERWARWWLDLARYADTNGQDENKVMANAWRYRDWVVDAFNADKPFDDFITEQLAGDLLPTDGVSDDVVFNRWIATGFLVLGPKMLAEQDKPKLVMDIVDEQIDTISRAFLGLTAGCARCHDHKFDPIPQRDYYALAGIFKSTRTMENLDFVSKFNERWMAPTNAIEAWQQHAKKVSDAKKAVDLAIKQANDALPKPLPENPREHYPDAMRTNIVRLEAEHAALQAAAPPEPRRALAVVDDQVVDLPVHLRGSHLNPSGAPVPRGFIRCLATPASALALPARASGRLELARWLTSPDNPLTARVIVNRLWQAHFGEGLVRTPDNFGVRGEPPTHPELLDWLAREFIRSGWSVKAMQRVVLCSQAYRQASCVGDANDAARNENEKTGKRENETIPSSRLPVFPSSAGISASSNRISSDVDPENRLLSRFPRQRLEAEMIRDALLVVSGRLDPAVGGTLVNWVNNEYTPGDSVSTAARRRSLYLPVVRDRVYDVFTIFDFANPSVGTAKRTPTVVSHQALFFLNSPLVKDCARSFAASLLAAPAPDDAARIRRAYDAAFSRLPNDAEIERAARFVAAADSGVKPESRLAAWSAWCQTLFAANEFMYRE